MTRQESFQFKILVVGESSVGKVECDNEEKGSSIY